MVKVKSLGQCLAQDKHVIYFTAALLPLIRLYHRVPPSLIRILPLFLPLASSPFLINMSRSHSPKMEAYSDHFPTKKI